MFLADLTKKDNLGSGQGSFLMNLAHFRLKIFKAGQLEHAFQNPVTENLMRPCDREIFMCDETT